MEAGLQMDEAGVLRDAGAPTGAEEAELEEEDEAELEAAAGGVNCPLLSEPELSRAGEDFFLAGRLLAPPPLCCCCRHLARRFLNQTCRRKRGAGEQGVQRGQQGPRQTQKGLLTLRAPSHPQHQLSQHPLTLCTPQSHP